MFGIVTPNGKPAVPSSDPNMGAVQTGQVQTGTVDTGGCPSGQYKNSQGQCVNGTGQPQPPTAPTAAAPTNLGNTQVNGNGGNFQMQAGADPQMYKEVQSALAQGGWSNEDPNYWYSRMKQTSGTFDQYWRDRIAAGPNGQQRYAENNSGSQMSIQPYNGPTGPSTPAPKPYQIQPAPASNIPTYLAQPINGPSPYEAPNAGQTNDVVKYLLGNTSMNDDVVAKMKEQQKQSVLDQQEQLKQQLMQSAAQRNVVGGGGTGAGLDKIAMAGMGDLSKAYGTIDIQKAIQDQTDRLNAVQASNNNQSGALNAYLGQGNLNLSYQQAKADQAAKEFASKQQAEQQAYNEYQGNQQLGLAGGQQAFSNWLGDQGLGLSYAQLMSGANQFNSAQQLAMLKFLAGGA